MRLRMVGSIVTVMLITHALTTVVVAEAPWHEKYPWPWSRYEGSRRVDVIGPIGNRLPESYRRTYNRPTYVGGKIAAKLEPSSQEAMAFHNANDLGLYDNNGIKGAMAGKHCPPRRVEQHYFYPKPWEVLKVGPRRDVNPNSAPSEAAFESDPPRQEKQSTEPRRLNPAETLNPVETSETEELPVPLDVLVELPPPITQTQ